MKKLNFSDLRKLLRDNYHLAQVSFEDSLEGNEEAIQECIRKGNYDELIHVNDYFIDTEQYAIDYYNKELKQDLILIHDLTEEEAEALIEHFDDELREFYYENDISQPLYDLVQKEDSLTSHYDTGYYMEGGSWAWDDERVQQELDSIKNHLGITTEDSDSDIKQMILQACGGGSLNIYFVLDIDLFVTNEKPTIEFSNFYLGIVNHSEGSGSVLDNPIFYGVVRLPFNRENVFIEKCVKYNFTYAIAGMRYDWCDSTSVFFTDNETKSEMQESPTNSIIKKDAEYNETYKNGSCSPGDMDIRRHRDLQYINNFPCGTKCPNCGTFWID
jgi:hypothetical protein